MKYLCDNHRGEFVNNPQQAIQAWQVIIEQARALFHSQDWQKASVAYGNAFEISELLLSCHSSSFSVDRYLRSALEYAYALRKEEANVNLYSLVQYVENNIQGIKHRLSVSLLLQPLEDVISMPINVADFWMVSLLSLDHIESRVLH
ncbi:hypothetical protein ACU6U9_14870 [Pseudomonas sp. HK3]